MGSEIRVDFGALTRRSVHPAAPVLLTKNGPLSVKGSVAGFAPEPEPHAPPKRHAARPDSLALSRAETRDLSGKPAISPVYSLRIG
jgi:hypothetical protein